MANGGTHRFAAAIAVGGILAHLENENGRHTVKPIFGAGVAAALANLPDKLEPAIHPHHRQFFHSIVCAVGVGIAGLKLYEWQPEEDWKKALRFVFLAGCGAYLIHLALDACTAKSLPLIGKL